MKRDDRTGLPRVRSWDALHTAPWMPRQAENARTRGIRDPDRGCRAGRTTRTGVAGSATAMTR